jgi:5'-deoxynucleotidase YfbR-like HD superfamily hydrolase
MKDRWEKLVDASSSDIRRLASVWRYSSIPIVADENTAEHSFWVTLYSALILQELGDRASESDVLGATLLYATIHDASECVTGDIIRLMKYATPDMKSAVDSAEDMLAKKHLHGDVLSLYGMSDSLMVTTGEKSLIKAVVKAADFISLFQFMRREALRGNLEIIPFYNRMIHDLGSANLHDVPFGNGQVFHQSQVYLALYVKAKRIADVCFHGLTGDENL